MVWIGNGSIFVLVLKLGIVMLVASPKLSFQILVHST
jgi:hypothetical protein